VGLLSDLNGALHDEFWVDRLLAIPDCLVFVLWQVHRRVDMNKMLSTLQVLNQHLSVLGHGVGIDPLQVLPSLLPQRKLSEDQVSQ